METIKNAIGLGSTPASGKEPVNADQGAGTVAEPFDGGNKEENVPAVTEAAADTPAGTSAATGSNGAEEIPAAKAVGASATKTADELGETAPVDTPVASATPIASETAVAVPVETKTETPATEVKSETPLVAPIATETKTKTPAPAPTAATETKTDTPVKTEKSKSIGGAGWFKDTLQRRKSKGNTLDEKSGKDKQPTAEALTAATAAAAVSSKPREKPIEKPVEKPIAPAPVVEKSKAEPVATKQEHKRHKSVSEIVKAHNPFKRRQSKAETKSEKQSTIKEEKAAVVVPPNQLTSDVPPGNAPPATANEQPPVGTEPAISTEPAASRYADEEIAPDALPAGTTATPAPVSEPTTDLPSEVANTVPAEETAVTETPAIAETPVAAPAPESTPADTKTALDAGPAEKTDVPTISEPVSESSKGKGSLVPANSENTSAIPTAGGIRLGEKAMEERKASIDIRRKSFVPSDVKPEVPPKDEPVVPETKAAETKAVETKADGTPTRRLSVFGKIKEKLKV